MFPVHVPQVNLHYYGALVHYGWYECVESYFMDPSHGHDDVDAIFGMVQNFAAHNSFHCRESFFMMLDRMEF